MHTKGLSFGSLMVSGFAPGLRGGASDSEQFASEVGQDALTLAGTNPTQNPVSLVERKTPLSSQSSVFIGIKPDFEWFERELTRTFQEAGLTVDTFA